MKNNVVELFNSFDTEFSNSRLVYMRIDTQPQIGKRYYINKLADRDGCAVINDVIVNGINSRWETNPQMIQLDGKEYNILLDTDMSKILMSLAKNKPGTPDMLIYKMPIGAFRGDLIMEFRYFNLHLDLGNSFIEFVDVPLVTPLPAAIPLEFIWNYEK